jgi:hypothetical protein
MWTIAGQLTWVSAAQGNPSLKFVGPMLNLPNSARLALGSSSVISDYRGVIDSNLGWVESLMSGPEGTSRASMIASLASNMGSIGDIIPLLFMMTCFANDIFSVLLMQKGKNGQRAIIYTNGYRDSEFMGRDVSSMGFIVLPRPTNSEKKAIQDVSSAALQDAIKFLGV